MRIAVCHPQTPFTRGGAEMHMEGMVRALRADGHDVDVVTMPFKWYPPSEIVHQMASWRSVDLSEANGQRIDMVIALKFPAYLVAHERKVVWLIHQHRTAYELWDHPEYGDLRLHEDGEAVRDMIHRADRVGLSEAKRIFTNSANVRDRLRRSVGLSADVLYHRSPLCEALLEIEPGPHGDHVLFPSRLEPLKRQSLAIDAMRHVRSGARLVLVGKGPGEDALRRRIAEAGLEDRVELAGPVPDEDLIELYRTALAVFYGPYDEDYGYVTIEAMAAGRPLVTCTDSGGPLELVRDGESGRVVASEPRAIARAIDALHEGRDEAARMGAAGRSLVEARVPPWPEVARRLLS
ncbi:MAG TPA: glycosyltransferase family 4 protein [Actinomycetota bacterium]